MKKIILFLSIFINLFAKEIIFSKNVYEALNSANKLIDEKKYKNAIDVLNKAKPEKVEEKAYIHSSLAQAYLSINDFKNASKNLEISLNFNVLPADMKIGAIYNLLQIYLIEQNHRKAISTFEKYQTFSKKIDPEIYGSIALSYLKIKKYNLALKYIKKALDKKPKNKNFMQILISIYYDKKDYKQVCSILESAYRLDILKSSYTKQIAHCLYKNNAPLRGAKFLDKAIKIGSAKNTKDNQKLLFNLYLDAKEYDEAYEIASKIRDKTVSLIIIQSLFDKGKYKKTIEASKTLHDSFDIKNRALVKMLEAQSYYYLHDKKNALKLFNEALKNDTTKRMAQDWIRFIQD